MINHSVAIVVGLFFAGFAYLEYEQLLTALVLWVIHIMVKDEINYAFLPYVQITATTAET